MSIKNEIPPQVSLYSSKMLFDQNDDRNKKRMAQMLKRKKKILQNQKEITNDKTSPSTQDTLQNINSFLSQFKNELNNNLNKNSNKIFRSSFFSKNIDSEFSSVNSNFEKFHPFLSEELSPTFNESAKEINISNISDLTSEKYMSPEKKKIEANLTKKIKKINNNINNEFALTYLSSHLNSFISLKNKLVTKAKYENNCFTTSYSLALFNDEKKKTSVNKSTIQDIILEEPESPTPKQTSSNIFSLLDYVKTTNTSGQIRSIILKPENHSHIKCLTNINDNRGNYGSLINNSKLKIPKNKLVLELKKKFAFNKKNNNSTIIENKKNIMNNTTKVINNSKVINNKKTKDNNKYNIKKYSRINKLTKTHKKIYKNSLVEKNNTSINNKYNFIKNNKIKTNKEVSFNETNNLVKKRIKSKNKNIVSRSKSQNKISMKNESENLTHQSKCFSNLSNNSNINEINFDKNNNSYSQKVNNYQRNNDKLRRSKIFTSKNKLKEKDNDNSYINKKPTINESRKISKSIFEFFKLYRKLKTKKSDVKINLIKHSGNVDNKKKYKKSEMTCSIKEKRQYKLNKSCYNLNKQQKAKTYFIFYLLFGFIHKYSG